MPRGGTRPGAGRKKSPTSNVLAAEQLGVSTRTLYRAKRIDRAQPELQQWMQDNGVAPTARLMAAATVTKTPRLQIALAQFWLAERSAGRWPSQTEIRARLAKLTAPTAFLAIGVHRQIAEHTIRTRHYTQSVPSGKSLYVLYDTAIVVWSIPANHQAAKHFLPGVDEPVVWELTRLWAPDGHRPNLLTQAISEGVKALRQAVPEIDLVISYADPSAGHHGGIYKAASWLDAGRSEEVRAWCRADGTGPILPRRAFHSGSTHLNKPDIEKLGYVQLKLPGKHRFARPLSKRAKKHHAPKG